MPLIKLTYLHVPQLISRKNTKPLAPQRSIILALLQQKASAARAVTVAQMRQVLRFYVFRMFII